MYKNNVEFCSVTYRKGNSMEKERKKSLSEKLEALYGSCCDNDDVDDYNCDDYNTDDYCYDDDDVDCRCD